VLPGFTSYHAVNCAMTCLEFIGKFAQGPTVRTQRPNLCDLGIRQNGKRMLLATRKPVLTPLSLAQILRPPWRPSEIVCATVILGRVGIMERHAAQGLRPMKGAAHQSGYREVSSSGTKTDEDPKRVLFSTWFELSPSSPRLGPDGPVISDLELVGVESRYRPAFVHGKPRLPKMIGFPVCARGIFGAFPRVFHGPIAHFSRFGQSSTPQEPLKTPVFHTVNIARWQSRRGRIARRLPACSGFARRGPLSFRVRHDRQRLPNSADASAESGKPTSQAWPRVLYSGRLACPRRGVLPILVDADL
jgi:hypothetical protein